MTGSATHWNEAYRRGATSCSWFQQHALPSLDLIARVGVGLGDSIIDVGGGASTLVDDLLDDGHTDLTVLDISLDGMRAAQRRLGPRAEHVHWLVADLRAWRPNRTWKVWHDRAVLHFFTTDADRRCYLDALDRASAPGSYALLATFAPGGPTHCSGLPVARYSAGDLAALLGDRWKPVFRFRQEHHTPAGTAQAFTWATFLRRDT